MTNIPVKQPVSKTTARRVRPRRDFAAMEERRMRAADLFEQGVRPAEIARQLGVCHQIVSDWRGAWRRFGRDGLRGAGRAGRLPKLSREQLTRVEGESSAYSVKPQPVLVMLHRPSRGGRWLRRTLP